MVSCSAMDESAADVVADWERRFRAPRVSLPDWAQRRPGPLPVRLQRHRAPSSSTPGTATPARRARSPTVRTARATARCRPTASTSGGSTTPTATSSASGGGSRSPAGPTRPAAPGRARPATPPGWSSGAAGGRRRAPPTTAAARLRRAGRRADGALRAASTTPTSPGCRADETLVVLEHSEHGDSRHRALRVLRRRGRTATRSAELWDGEGSGLSAARLLAGGRRPAAAGAARARRAARAAVLGDPRPATETELPTWRPARRARRRLVPGRQRRCSCAREHAGARRRCTGWTCDGGDDRPLDTPARHGRRRHRPARRRRRVLLVVRGRAARHPLDVRGDGRAARRPGRRRRRPSPSRDVFVDGPGGPVHALRRAARRVEGPLPDGVPRPRRPDAGTTATPSPPTARRTSTWGARSCRSTTAARPATARPGATPSTGRPGLTELEDIAAVHDGLVADGLADPARVALTGGSWGGYLTLLGPRHAARALGAAASPAVPVADYVAAYEDEMEPLRAFDRSLFGGSPDEVPERYERLLAADLRRRGARAGAGARRRQRPALPDPADRELPRRRWPRAARTSRSTASTPATARWSSTSGCGRCAPSWSSSPAASPAYACLPDPH